MPEAWKSWEGQVLNGEFHLRQYLGSSEHSAVFLVEHWKRRLQKAAIKLIVADPRSAELQLSRWRQTAKLSHPHLIRLFQMGRSQLGNKDLLYLVMEYVDEDLAQVLPYRPLTPAEAREMLKATLEALAYLHCKGFVHGRIKPANIMAIDDQLKLSSDGLCRMAETSGGLGTPGVYDPPEAANGRCSPAGDVWSLGMTLVEALTQHLPVWERTEGGEPVVPLTLPPPFLDIACHCLRRDPQLRWTVAEIVAWLQPPSPVPPLPAPRQKTSARPQKAFSNWWYILPPIAFGLTLAALLAGPRLWTRRAETRPAPSVVSEQPSVQPKPERKPVTREAGPSKQKTGEEERSSSGTAPLPSSLRSSGAGAKTPASGLVQGEVLQEVLPEVPQKARDTIRGTVRVGVRVAVDASGGVVGATLDSPGPSKYFANLALQAARRWEFRSAEADGRFVSSEWILRFEFERAATKAFPMRATP